MSLTDVACFKIHPAIGVARISNNENWFEFFDAHAKKFSPPQDYMSADASDTTHPQKPRMKRQAVQFKVYAYKSNGDLIGEVSQLFPDLQVHWTAEVGNRKLHNYTSKRGTGIVNPINARATATLPAETASLDGINPWDPGATINLGSISGTGLFIPAKGGLTRKQPVRQSTAILPMRVGHWSVPIHPVMVRSWRQSMTKPGLLLTSPSSVHGLFLLRRGTA